MKKNNTIFKEWVVTPSYSGWRVDNYIHNMLPDFSRSLVQRAIKRGEVLVDNKSCKPSYPLRGLEKVCLLSDLHFDETEDQPQKIDLDIVYQDQDIIVINKPAGLVVHPGAGNKDRTLVNALLYAFPELSNLPRAGLVHRLDKQTSGLLVVARNSQSHSLLIKQMQERKISRIYTALCQGVCNREIHIDQPLGRSPYNRTKMAIVATGKPALTYVKPIRLFSQASLLQVTLHTGRTHQIRVHMLHIGFPLVGDPVYKLHKSPVVFHRQALHASELHLSHPQTQERMSFHAELPDDFSHLIDELNNANLP